MTVIATLITTLGLESSTFKSGLDEATKALRATQKKFAAAGAELQKIGGTMSLAFTTPIATAGVAVVKMAGDFEASMNRVGISTKAGASKMEQMSKLALRLGKDTTFSASEASDAMDMLAKNGLSARDILNGAATAALNLASAAGSELSPAAAAITDTLQQFKMTTKDLPSIVNQITGAVNQSKLDFVDFQGAAAQAGGVAANVGVRFTDFTAALAGISPLFASGSDAGTSFKTFLTSLGDPSSKAAEEIKRLGLSFYDATGKLRPMADIAEQLRQKIGGLRAVRPPRVGRDRVAVHAAPAPLRAGRPADRRSARGGARYAAGRCAQALARSGDDGRQPGAARRDGRQARLRARAVRHRAAHTISAVDGRAGQRQRRGYRGRDDRRHPDRPLLGRLPRHQHRRHAGHPGVQRCPLRRYD